MTYPIGYVFEDRKEVIKACLDGAFVRSSSGKTFTYIYGGFYHWLEGCEVWDVWHVVNEILDAGPWTVVADPSKPVSKPYSEMTPEEQRARLLEVLGWGIVKVTYPCEFNGKPEGVTYSHSNVHPWANTDIVAIETGLRLGAQVTKGDG